VRGRWPYLAALGAGCLVGAGGVFLVQRLAKSVDHHRLVGEAALRLGNITGYKI